MLGRKTYSQDYIDQVRAQVDADVAAYAALDGAASGEFEHRFFNNMVIVLDHYFCHRLRTQEGKDGNPANEVRVVAESLMEHGGTLTANSPIKLKPDKTILGYEAGDAIKLSQDDFRRLADGFLAEIETRFSNDQTQS